MKTAIITTIVTLLALIMAIPAFAQEDEQTIRISGEVWIDMLPPATLTIQDVDGNRYQTDVNQDTGYFVFENLPAGEYFLRHDVRGQVMMCDLLPGYNIINFVGPLLDQEIEDPTGDNARVVGTSDSHRVYLPIIIQ